jgi:hypothetical protein
VAGALVLSRSPNELAEPDVCVLQDRAEDESRRGAARTAVGSVGTLGTGNLVPKFELHFPEQVPGQANGNKKFQDINGL